jgi:hypothetical protein
MTRSAVTALVAVCRVVLGEGSIAEHDALSAAEAWAGGETATDEEYHVLRKRLGQDERGEAVYWTLAAAFDADDSAYCTTQALATLAVLPGWDDASVEAIHASFLAPRDTIPAPAPEFQEAA